MLARTCVCIVAAVVPRSGTLSRLLINTEEGQRLGAAVFPRRRPHKTPFVRSSPQRCFLEASGGLCQWPVPGMLWKFFFVVPAAVVLAAASEVQPQRSALRCDSPNEASPRLFVCAVAVSLCRVAPRHLLCYHNIGPPCFSSPSTDSRTSLSNARGWRRSQSVPS